jgi:hypothetical protein
LSYFVSILQFYFPFPHQILSFSGGTSVVFVVESNFFLRFYFDKIFKLKTKNQLASNFNERLSLFSSFLCFVVVLTVAAIDEARETKQLNLVAKQKHKSFVPQKNIISKATFPLSFPFVIITWKTG